MLRNPHERRSLLQFEIVTATMRLRWAKAAAKRNPTTRELANFIDASRVELAKLKGLVKRRVSRAAPKI